jgi:spore coat protein A
VKLWTRRTLLKQAALASAAGNILLQRATAMKHADMAMPRAQPRAARTLDTSRLQSFVDPLPLPILQRPTGRRSSAVHLAVNVPYFRVNVRETACKLHRDLPPSRLWSYGVDSSAPVLFETRRSEGVLVEWVNQLPEKHFLPIHLAMRGMDDSTQMLNMAHAPETRISTHLHGACVPAISDGYPDDWFGPGKSRLCFYPNQQAATMLWMHDHAMGTSRFNVLAGLMGLFLIRDEAEDELDLPRGKYELPLMIYDRSFTPGGEIYYPNPPDEGMWTEEYLGDAILVNGKVRPFHEVEPRRYRLRIVNSANARFLSLALSNGMEFEAIGADQGLLPSPVAMKRLVLSPAERADIIIDFSRTRGEQVLLVSDGIDLMQFRVSSTSVQDESRVPAVLRRVERIPESAAIHTRELTLNEFDAERGDAMVMLLNRTHWAQPVTEVVKLGTTEIWSLINLTTDTHPIHLHMVRFQILDRQSFSDFDYLASEEILSTGPRTLPAPHESGWKDVVQCPGYTISRIIVPFHGYAGRYLWHCHILEHEANDMMRPYDVVA